MDAPHVSVLLAGWDLAAGRLPEATLNAAREAERLGLDGVAAGDHVSFYGRGNDALTTLTAIAAVTVRVQLRTSIYLLPLRHPVPVALQAAQLDQLSLGRLVLGVGVGGEDPHEFESCGVDPRHRGGRTDESIAILRRLWTEDDVTWRGRHFDLEGVSVNPKPLQPIPVHIGGRSEAALRRAGRLGDGYIGLWLTPERFASARESIAEVAEEALREVEVEAGMQFWVGVASSRPEARNAVATAMEGMYRLPFDRFERFTPFGSPGEVATFVAPYVEAGARHLTFIPGGAESPERGVEDVAAIREELRRMFPLA